MTPRAVDRVSGAAVDFSDLAGRSSLRGQFKLELPVGTVALQNGATATNGDFIVPTPAANWRVDPACLEGPFEREPETTLDEASARKIGAELTAVTSWRDWSTASPLVRNIDERIELQEFERYLMGSRGLGHLERVCLRPRDRLDVEVERTLVSRARRIPVRAIGFLASHSEDWERRTLQGVEPKRVLAEVRTDDFDLYENRVAARLVDALDRYLVRRLAEVRALAALLADVENYSREAGGAHWRSRRLFELWGQGYREGSQRSAAQTLRVLEAVHLRVRTLLGSVLYRAVPRSALVDASLRSTNIFANDLRYREVAALWRELQKTPSGPRKEGVPTLEQQYRDEQESCLAFVRFVHLLVVRALVDFALAPADSATIQRGGSVHVEGRVGPLTVRWSGEHDALEIADGPTTRVRFLAIPVPLGALSESARARQIEGLRAAARSATVPTVIVYPGRVSDQTPANIAALAHELPLADRVGAGVLPTSPYDLGSVERIARAIRWAVHAPRLCATELQLPTNASSTLQAHLAAERWVKQGRLPAFEEGARFLDSLALEVQRLRAEADNVRSKREQVGGELRDEHRAGRKTSDLNVRKKDLHGKIVAAGSALAEAEAFAGAAGDYVTQKRLWLRCPVCPSGDVDPADRSAFQADSTSEFMCQCYECASRWARRKCAKCGAIVPTLVPVLPAWPPDRARDRPGWICAVLGRDVLASPCPESSPGEGFVCPECTTCSCGGSHP